MGFQLAVTYRPRGDQAAAIDQLFRGVVDGDQHQVLLGVTGSGKTFTMAQVIEKTGTEQRPAIVPVLRGKVIYLSFGEMKRTQKVDCRREPACERESTAKRVLPKSNVERCLVIAHTGFPIAARHRDLIKIRRECREVMLWWRQSAW